ncbi:NADP-dependent 3-hydroxy acid dehydrogenase YdfG [Pseudomonas sp. 8AS]|uniref:SDR family NAD(P)-dependent oxidoreductase n=1 Tax=Pseudomonas sp. 8AS TaxID=2653163 RepID=UPI0012F1229B|nr:SDR family NAD(P)-dependent oxidoreductase [Pseudomonas sp. 8AS]VXC11078.1 NADP-dependent 3-hydroxy acid dehydrogenase YdfG [Pseudomonas sp. 8AS]
MTEQQQQVAVITGAASGIGRGLAERAAARGYALVLADRDSAALERLAAQLRTEGAAVLAQVTDVAEPGQLEELRDAALDRFGAVDLLFNNAGVMQTGSCWEISEAQWQRALAVNLGGVINGVRAFLPLLLAQGRPAHVVNTASLAGLLNSPFMAAYNVSKQAVVALSESLHYEMAALNQPIGISVLCPGPVVSEIMTSDQGQGADSEFNRLLDDHIRQGMSPPDVAELVFEAIAEKRFWILPHKGFKPALRTRLESVLSESNPQFTPFDPQGDAHVA